MTTSDIANGNTRREGSPSEEIVFRRRAKNKRHSADSKQKRVSFHEEVIQNVELVTAEPNDTKERFNCCEETLKRSESSSSGGSSLANLLDDFAAMECGSKTGCDSSTPLSRVKSAPLSAKSSKDAPRLRQRDKAAAGVMSAVRSLIAGSPSAAARSIQSLPSTERGVPEGQEDPPLSASTLDLYHHADVAERLRDGEPRMLSSAGKPNACVTHNSSKYSERNLA